MSERHEVWAADGGDDEFGSGVNGGLAGGDVEDGADADEGARAEFLRGLANGGDCIGCRHGDLDGEDAAGEEGFGQGDDLVGAFGADDGDDAGVGEGGDDL